MSAEPTSPELPSVEGERAASPVSGARKSDRRSMHRRGIGAVALIAFGALFIWGWGRPKGKIDEAGATPIVSQRTRYEPPRNPLPARNPPAAGGPHSADKANAEPRVDRTKISFSMPPGAHRFSSTTSRPRTARKERPAIRSSLRPRCRRAPFPSIGRSLARACRPIEAHGARWRSGLEVPNRSLLVAQGTPIPCLLETAMSSDVPGFVSCVVARDVMSDDGHVVLMEKGTQVVGEYRGQVRRGSSRMFVLWNRAKTPTGVIVSLSSPATDALGRSGFDGQIDSHSGSASAARSCSRSSAMPARSSGSGSPTAASRSTPPGSAGQSAAAIATEQSINIPPTLLKNQGEHVSIFVARDLDFSSVYTLRRIGTRTEILDRAIGVRPRQPVYKP